MLSHLAGPSPHTPLCPLLSSHIRTFTTPGVHMCFSSLSLCSCRSLCLDPSALFPSSPPRKTPLTLQKKKKKTVLKPSPQKTTQMPHLDLLFSSLATTTLFCHIIFFLLILMGVDGA